MRRPIPHHQHLHRHWRVPCHRKKLLRRVTFLPLFPVSHANLFAVHFHCPVDRAQPRILSFDLKRNRRQIVLTLETRCQRHIRPAIRKLEVHFNCQPIPVLHDRIGLRANRLLKLVKPEGPAFHHNRVRRRRILPARHRRMQSNANGPNSAPRNHTLHLSFHGFSRSVLWSENFRSIVIVCAIKSLFASNCIQT